MRYRLQHLSPATAWQRRDDIAAVYRDAFGVEHEMANSFRDRSLQNVLTYPGATVIVAMAGGEIVGFVYAYTYLPNHWWPQQVGPRLLELGHGEMLQDALELLELAVVPRAQGNGIGTALMKEILASTAHAHMFLNTSAAPDNDATRLYCRLGFRVLIPGFQYMPHGEPNLIMAWSRDSR